MAGVIAWVLYRGGLVFQKEDPRTALCLKMERPREGVIEIGEIIEQDSERGCKGIPGSLPSRE